MKLLTFKEPKRPRPVNTSLATKLAQLQTYRPKAAAVVERLIDDLLADDVEDE